MRPIRALLHLLSLSCLLLSALSIDDNAHKIKHVITLMMENRSFDHYLGWLHETIPEINGLNGTECLHIHPMDPKSRKYCVNKHGFDEGPDDPRHSFHPTTNQIYGYNKPVDKTAVPRMNGFVADARAAKHNLSMPISMFTEHHAPVLNGLAREYAVFDRWFCSIPGPTDPNREYLLSGTSAGRLVNFKAGHLLPQQSYFDWLRERNVSWNAYYQDDPWSIAYFADVHEPENSKFVHHIEKFFTDLEHGHLAQFVFLQPRMTAKKGLPTWQHPDASVKEGEKLMQRIYQAVRKSKFWESLALVITYDEHGGFYDHVPPPQEHIPSPDDIVSPEGFNFDRLGIRVPTVVISPWVEAGTIVHNPPHAQRPTNHSEYEHTSVMSTVNKLLGIREHMSKRAAWSGTFEHVFSRREPRRDTPYTFAVFQEHTQEDLLRQRSKPLNDHLEIQVEFYCRQNGYPEDSCNKYTFTNQGDASDFIETEAERLVAKWRLAEARAEQEAAANAFPHTPTVDLLTS